MAEPELPLLGGTLNTVVRVGDTVRRPAGGWTHAVHDLLRHVRARGFDLAPEPLGTDDDGREVLSFIPGTTVGWSLPWPEVVRSDDMLVQIGEATARYHQAVADFRPSGTIPWQLGAAELAESQIVCHHDLAPYNTVIADGRLAGIIDWDLAGPGTARSDLAFVAWQWVPLQSPAAGRHFGWSDTGDRARRLALLLDAYGLDERGGFIEEIAERIRYNREVMARRAREGNAGYKALVDQGHLAGMDAALRYLREEGHHLQDAL
jgi:Phosphotransferase enzyme family